MPDLELADHQTIHFIDDNPTGDPTVLLIHGLGVTGESWGFQLPELKHAGYRAIAPDLRGFGKSSYPGGENHIQDLAGDMACLLERVQAAPAHIVGISLGGAVAMQLAISYPHLVDRLILINTFAHLRPERRTAWIYFLLRGIILNTLGMHTQGVYTARRLFPREDHLWLRQQFLRQLAQSNPTAFRGTVRSILQFNITGKLGEIRSQTLVLTGTQDETVPQDVQRRLAQSILGARQVFVPGGRHAMIVVETEAVNRALLEFLGRAK